MENNIYAKPEIKKRSKKEINDLVNNLLNQMTLKEKIGQMYQTSYYSDFVTGPKFEASQVVQLVKEGRVGSFLGIVDENMIISLQKKAVYESRLHIPLFFALDIIHGCKTSFPTNLALSSTFNPKLIENISKAVAYETSHIGINLTYSPMVDVVRDPRWGRVMESNGEDPYLSSVLASSYVKGYQQPSISDYNSVSSCTKHFIAYGRVEAGREYNTVDVSKIELNNFYVPPFKSAINSGTKMVMSSFNTIDAIPVTANKDILKGLLRKKLKFNGVLISDYTASEEIKKHKVARDDYEVAKKCLEATLDHEMISTCYLNNLEELVKENSKYLDYINEACKRVLTLKYEMGLFDNPFKAIYEDSSKYVKLDKFKKLSLKAANESIVLLKNKDDILPLNKKNKVILDGPYADSKDMVGAWGGLAKEEDVISLKEAFIRHNVKENEDSDYVILCLGEPSNYSGEAKSRSNIDIPFNQKEIFDKYVKLNKKIILIVYAGRPLILTDYVNKAEAVIYAWQLGMMSGEAIYQTLFGINNPSGKLTMSFPYSIGQIPIYYNHLNTGRPLDLEDMSDTYRSYYLDIPNEPLFPFGYGLSYSKFIYQNIKVNMGKNNDIEINFEIYNDSDYKGYESYQIYIEALSYSYSRPVNELKKFNKVLIKPKETVEIKEKLKINDLGYYNEKLEWILDSNREFLIKIGSSSADLKSFKIKI